MENLFVGASSSYFTYIGKFWNAAALFNYEKEFMWTNTELKGSGKHKQK